MNQRMKNADARRIGMVLVGAGLMAFGPVYAEEGPAGYEGHPFYRRAQAEARLLPCTPIGERVIKVDGDLGEWDLPVDSFPLHQLLDHTVPDFHQSWKAAWEGEATDGALVKLMRGPDALYIAVKVADRAVVSPAGDERLNGDVVDMYLDLRPLDGEGPRLGHVKFTEGVYQIVFAPPSSDGLSLYVKETGNAMYPDWQDGKTVPPLGPFEAAGRLFAGGYAIEVRIPLASFPHKLADDRLEQPIGFEVLIADQDASRPKGQPERMYYSCSGYSGGSDYFKSPAMLACTDPALRTALPLSRLRRNPLKTAPGGDEDEGWIVTALNEKDVPGAFTRAGETGAPAKTGSVTTYACPALGLAFHHRRVLSRLPAACPAAVGNRYMAVFPADGRKVAVDGDLKDWDGFPASALTLYQSGNLPNVVTLPGRTDSADLMLMTDGDTLYVSMRVRDDSVVIPAGDENQFAGDCVQVFLDVRPLAAEQNALSHNQYTDGVYHFLVAPPTAGGRKAAFRQGDQKVRRAGPVEVACVPQKDGYTLEMAIPAASLLDPPVPGRFRQFFGFEVVVTDVDRRGNDDAPVVHYSWSGAEEEQIVAQPAYFCGTGYVPDRLPEIRALVDASPVRVTVDVSRPLGSFSGFGGIYLRDGSLTHTGGHASQYGLGAANTLYVPEHLRYAWARINLQLFEWEWVNDNEDPKTTDLSRFKTKEGQPGYDPHDDDGPHYWNQVNQFLEMFKPLAGKDVRLVAYADSLPAWLVDGNKKNGNYIQRQLWPEYAECVGSFLLCAKEKHGIEFELFALRNARFGTVSFSQESYPEVLKCLGEYFAKHGLKTKLMLCDTDAVNDFRWYARMLHDPDLLRFIGGVGVETEGPLDAQLPTYRLWRDMAEYIDRPLIITGFGRPYVSSATYLFEEVRIWQQMMAELRPQAALIRQFIAERTGTKWMMLPGRMIEQDRARGLPALRQERIVEEREDVLTTQRFWITKHFCELTPSGSLLQSGSDHPQVLVSAFSGTQGAPPAFTIHVSNAGPARRCALGGLPPGVKGLHVVRTGSGETFKRATEVTVKDGQTEVDLPAWSLVTLTTLSSGD